MQVSTKLFNDQQIRQFGKLTADIQEKQEKIASGKQYSEHLTILLPRGTVRSKRTRAVTQPF